MQPAAAEARACVDAPVKPGNEVEDSVEDEPIPDGSLLESQKSHILATERSVESLTTSRYRLQSTYVSQTAPVKGERRSPK